MTIVEFITAINKLKEFYDVIESFGVYRVYSGDTYYFILSYVDATNKSLNKFQDFVRTRIQYYKQLFFL